MGTKLLLGFGGTVIQVVVHPVRLPTWRHEGFGGTVIQVVVHPDQCPGWRFDVSEVP